MEPNLKTILDEIKSLSVSMADLKSSVTERIEGVEHAFDERFKRIEDAAGEFSEWKPKVDASIDDVRMELGAMRKTVNRVVLESNSASAAGIFPAPVSASAPSAASISADGPDGHRVDHNIWENAHGSVYTHSHSPGKGMSFEPSKPVLPAFSHQRSTSPVSGGFNSGGSSQFSKIPKL